MTWRSGEEESERLFPRSGTENGCKDGECVIARIGRQEESVVHLMRWTNSFWAWTGLVKIRTVAKLKKSVPYAQVFLKVW